VIHPPYTRGREVRARSARANGDSRRRYWEHIIRDAEDWRRNVENHPVKHGLVGAVRDWALSSFHRDVRRGLVPEDWAGDVVEGPFGE
jgi:putative transposase